MTNILFDTQYGNNSKIADTVIAGADIVVYFGGSVDFSILNRFKNIKLILGHNVMIDLDEISKELASITNSNGRFFISDKAFIAIPIDKKADTAHDNKHGLTGWRMADAYIIRGEQEREYLDRNSAVFKYMINFSSFYNENKDKKILFINTDGALLDIDTGYYPYVVPYSTTVAGAIEAGLPPNEIQNTIGIVRSYSLREGKGIVPTEYSDKNNQKNIGRLDLVALKDICRNNSVSSLILSDIYAYDDFDIIEVCVAYKDATYPLTDTSKIIPIYKTIEGWKTSTIGINKMHQLPLGAKEFIGLIQSTCEVMVDSIDTSTDCITRWDYWNDI